MITIEGEYKSHYRVNLNVDSFEDITTDYMTIDESDDIIKEAIAERYGIYPDSIQVKGECI